jgi:hypothetical protein
MVYYVACRWLIALYFDLVWNWYWCSLSLYSDHFNHVTDHFSAYTVTCVLCQVWPPVKSEWSNTTAHSHCANVENFPASSVQPYSSWPCSKLTPLLQCSYISQLAFLYLHCLCSRPERIQFWIPSHHWLLITWHWISYINCCELFLMWQTDRVSTHVRFKRSRTRVLNFDSCRMTLINSEHASLLHPT